MSQAHHPDPVEENLETHPVQLAIWVVIGSVALIIGIIMLVQFAIGAYGGRSLENDAAMAPAVLAKRIAPVARLQVEGEPPVVSGEAATRVSTVATPAAASTPAPAPVAAAGGKVDGKKTYESACLVCHASGVAGAPKVGDKAAWEARIKAGVELLHASAIKGKGAMPPKGGNASLTDADVKAAVDYMVAGSK